MINLPAKTKQKINNLLVKHKTSNNPAKTRLNSLLAKHKPTNPLKGQSKNIWRGTALALCLLILATTVMPAVSVYAQEVQGDDSAEANDTTNAATTENGAETPIQTIPDVQGKPDQQRATPLMTDAPHKAKAPDTKTKMKQNYPGPLNTQGNGATATNSATATADKKASTITQLVGDAQTPMGEVLPSVGDKPKVKSGEITDKRTANSTFTRNADGTITEKRYMGRINYKKDGKWEKIDTKLIEDKNAGDAGTVWGRALGQVESWVSSTTNFTVAGNDWQARFSPSDSDRGMMRVQQGDSQVGFVPVGAKQVAPVVTADNKGNQTVHYYDLWPGVNVSYTVTGSAIKEDIELKNKDAANQMQFRIVGAQLARNEQGGFTVKGAFGDKHVITPVNLIINKSGPVTDASVFGQTYKNGVLTVQVDKNYLRKLPASAFPVVIDPGYDTTNGLSGSDYYRAVRSDGPNEQPMCNFYTSPMCKIYIGGTEDMNGADRYWRSLYYAPYTRFQNTNYRLVVAKLYLNMQTGEGWHGDTGDRWISAWRSLCNTGFNCIDSNSGGGETIMGTSGEIDLTGLYQQAISVGDYGMWLMLRGEEDAYFDSYKELDPAYTYITFTWGDAPPAPAIAVPSSGQVFTDPQVSFHITSATNPNNQTPLQYQLRVSTASNGSGTIIDSGQFASSQWTIPDGMLQDGTTYYVQSRSIDTSGSGAGPWSQSVEFKIDMRTGKDKTQTYDTLGPVDIDLANGNVATSASSHSSAALGGSLGVSLDYNSPVRTRMGLRGQYYNNTALSGTPVVNRVDQNIDFEWAQSGPSAGMNADNFSAQWDGYFVVPATGDYYFGSNHDDTFSVTVNSQSAYNSGGNTCMNAVCYGATPISLTAGQVVPIHASYIENTGNAYVKLWAKGAVPEGAMPTSWFRTDPRPISQNHGLTGTYFFDDGSHNISTAPMFMQRTDPWVNFAWESAAPVANGPTDNFMARWTGVFTAPADGTYIFGAYSDDGVRITVGNDNTQVLNQWQDQVAADRWGSGYTLTKNQSVPIKVEYFEHTGGASMSLKVKGAVVDQVVPTAWLSPKAQVLPDGWNLGLDPDGDLSYDHAKINPGSVVLTDSAGSTHEYTYAGGSYKPPVNEDGHLVRNADGTLTLADVDGRTYNFDADGTLKLVTNPLDDRKPAALQYSYQSIEGGSARLTQITDGVTSDRWAKVYYSGQSQCGTIPARFSATPANMLCAVQTNDGRTTYFYYDQYGQLARIAQPGNANTDYEYFRNGSTDPRNGLLVAVRDSLANDAIAAGVRTEDANAATQISYDILGRATSVKQPAATAGATRTEHSIEYLPAGTGYWGASQQHVVGATEPNGFSRRIEYDALYRTTRDTDIANLSTTQEWDAIKDLLYSTTDATGLKSTTIYDDEDRPTESFGPAPTAWYGTDRKPTSTYTTQTPHTQTKYDENIQGPQVAWYNSRMVNDSGTNKPLLYGAPKLHTTGITPTDPTNMGRDFTANPAPISVDSGNDSYAYSATGKIVFPQSGTYQFRMSHSDGARLFIDDQSKFPDSDWWYAGNVQIISQGTIEAVAGKVYRFRLDYVNRYSASPVTSWLSGPGITDTNGPGSGTPNWGVYVRPSYNLTTSNKTYDATLGDSTSTTNYGANPELGLAQSTSVDPTGLNLTTTSTYETQGATGSFLRQTAKYLPGANTAVASTGTQYSYYSATETRDDPCTTTVEAYKQAGMLKVKTDPDPDGTDSQTPRSTETIYDDAGKVVATRYNAENWTCTSYDARERVTQVHVPAFGDNPDRTIQNNYAIDGNPLVTATYDEQGWIITTVDLLGRTVDYTDTWGDWTGYEYNDLGQLTRKYGDMGEELFTYDNLRRLSTHIFDGTTYATVSYDQYSRIDHVDYNDAGQLQLTYGRDTLGRITSQTYRKGDGTAGPADTVTRATTGDILSGTENGAAKTYTYDQAGRLTAATIGSNTYAYGYGLQDTTVCGPSSSRNPNSGKNGNRTSQTVNGNTTYFCYDYADRLGRSTNLLYNQSVYDAHGNTTKIGSAATPLNLGYDSSDRNSYFTQLNSAGTGTGMYYNRDIQNRITYREKDTITNWNWSLTAQWFYGFTGSGDSLLNNAYFCYNIFMNSPIQKREKNVQQAVANERLEGLKVSQESRKIAANYIAGKASAKSVAAKIRTRYGVL